MDIGRYCNRQVVVAEADTTVQEAAKIMRKHHVGDIVIVEPSELGQRPIGIITDRDLVVEVLAQDVDMDKVTVTDLMVNDLITVQESDDLMDVLNVMRKNGIRRIPVVSQNEDLVGILTVDDIFELISEQMINVVNLIGREIEEEEILHS